MARSSRRRPLDWVVHPDAYGTAFDFAGPGMAFVPMTLWLASEGADLPLAPGLFESASALTVERVRIFIWTIIRNRGDADRVWQFAARLRVGEQDVADPLVSLPVIPPSYDIDEPVWANEDLLWEHRQLYNTYGPFVSQPAPIAEPIVADVRSRRRLELPDQLQLVLSWNHSGTISPAEPTELSCYVWARTLLSSNE